MQAGCGRSDVVQIIKDATGIQGGVYFSIERLFPGVRAMMDSKAGYDRVEASKLWQGRIEIVGHDLNFVVTSESFACGFQHRGRKVQGDSTSLQPVKSQQRQQTTISGAQVQNPANLSGDHCQQDRFSFRTVRQAIRSRQILQRVLRRGILIHI